MRAEFDAVRLDFPDLGEAEDLKSAAVGKDGPVLIFNFRRALR